MKSPKHVVQDVARFLGRSWASELLSDDVVSWPRDFSTAAPRGAALEQADDLFGWLDDWNRWLHDHAEPGLELRRATRIYRTSRQPLPTHLVVPSIDAGARLAGSEWTARIGRARLRIGELRERLDGTELDAPAVQALDRYSDLDFTLMLAAVAWFRRNPSSRLTPRQVPILGLHSKWLAASGRRDLICRLAAIDGLGLEEQRPHAVNFTYLDPCHRAGGGRRYDSVVPGDNAVPLYVPSLALICENRDSALFFPEFPGTIAIQGAGHEGPARLEELLKSGWLAGGTRLVYWGDIDAAGLEIVDAYRTRGVAIDTILMDVDTLHEYAAYGVNVNVAGAPIQRGHRQQVGSLTPGELAAYAAVTDVGGQLPARLEQERIPLTRALAAVIALTAGN